MSEFNCWAVQNLFDEDDIDHVMIDENACFLCRSRTNTTDECFQIIVVKRITRNLIKETVSILPLKRV